MDEGLLKFIATDGRDGPPFLRFLTVLITGLPGLFCIIVLYFQNGDLFGFAYLSVLSPLLIFFLIQDLIADKVGRMSKVRVGYTYEYASLLLFAFALSGVSLVLWISYYLENLSAGFTYSLMFILPVISLFRRNLFCDAQCIGGEI